MWLRRATGEGCHYKENPMRLLIVPLWWCEKLLTFVFVKCKWLHIHTKNPTHMLSIPQGCGKLLIMNL